MRAIIKQWLIVLALCLTFIAPMAQGEYADVTINNKAEKEGMRPVIFPHWIHRIRFTCNVCHNPDGFVMRAGYNNITMEAIAKGKFCGMCHNGKIAWAPDRCDMCHSGKPGLMTGVQRGEQTRGPADR
jgi:c(7)-type cytochrome triheme protein